MSKDDRAPATAAVKASIVSAIRQEPGQGKAMRSHIKQIHSRQQELALQYLAKKQASQGCLFLEIGSWYGDSTVILGQVAKAFGGKLVCVDWWKGNQNTEQTLVAENDDVFRAFWERIEEEGLGDTVIPLRSESSFASRLLRPQTFNLVFIDGDHTYNGTLADIQNYAPMVAPQGLFCGHDCEGYLDDFDPAFLEEGKHADCHETVHCGVVLAAGEMFRGNHEIVEGIWCTQMSESPHTAWQRPAFHDTGASWHKQTDVPPLRYTASHVCFRYGRYVYAVSRDFPACDIREETVRNHPDVIRMPTKSEMEQYFHGKIVSAPRQIDLMYCYNIVEYGGQYYAVSVALGSMDFSMLTDTEIGELLKGNRFGRAQTLRDIRVWIEECADHDIPLLVAEHEEHNVVCFQKHYYGIRKDLGPINITEKNVAKLIRKKQCFVGRTIKDVVDQIAASSR